MPIKQEIVKNVDRLPEHNVTDVFSVQTFQNQEIQIFV